MAHNLTRSVLEIPSNHNFIMVGKTGAGKTTFFKDMILYDVFRAQQYSIDIVSPTILQNGKFISDLKKKSNVGVRVHHDLEQFLEKIGDYLGSVKSTDSIKNILFIDDFQGAFSTLKGQRKSDLQNIFNFMSHHHHISVIIALQQLDRSAAISALVGSAHGLILFGKQTNELKKLKTVCDFPYFEDAFLFSGILTRLAREHNYPSCPLICIDTPDLAIRAFGLFAVVTTD